MNETAEIKAWLRVYDGARFRSEMARAAASVKSVGAAARANMLRFGEMTNASRGASAILSRLGAGARWAASGLGVLTVATGVFGLKFNATMEQNKVAFTNFLGSGRRAERFLNRLYSLAARTPFEFPELVNASVKLLGFGMTAKQTYGWMRTLGDAVAGVGGGAEEIQRATLALGQMQAKGKVSMEELNQLTEARLPAIKILTDELGLTRKELSNIGAEGISAAKALPALQRGLDKMFGGMARKQSRTFTGQLSTMRDQARQVAGALTEPLFNILRSDIFPRINAKLAEVTKWARGGGVRRVAAGVSAGFTGAAVGPNASAEMRAGAELGATLRDVAAAGKVVWAVLKGVGGAVAWLVRGFREGNPLAVMLVGALGGLAVAFKVLIPLIGLVNMLLAANPVVLIVVGIAALVGALVALYLKVDWFRKGVDKAFGLIKTVAGAVFGFIGDHWRLILTVMLGPIVPVVAFIVKHFGTIRRVFGAVVGFIKDHWKLIGVILLGPLGPVVVLVVRNFDRIKEGFGRAFRGIARVAKAVFNAVKGIVRDALDWISDKVDWLIDKAKSIPGVSRLLGLNDDPGAEPIRIGREPSAYGHIPNALTDPDVLALPGLRRAPDGLTPPRRREGRRARASSRRTVNPLGLGSLALAGGARDEIHVIPKLDGKEIARSIVKRADNDRARKRG
jgi:tape measure domain-containing protein